MVAKILEINNKNKHPFSGMEIRHFDYTEREEVSLEVLDNHNISLCCLDPLNRQAIFVETPQEIDIYKSPFIRNTQFEYAKRLISISYGDLHKIADCIESPNKNLIIIHYVSRCGSTLLCNLLARLDNCISLAEMDIFTNICDLRNIWKYPDKETIKILQSCTRICCKLPNRNYILKPRHTGICLGDWLYHLFPDSKTIFLYRNVEDVVKSYIRICQNNNLTPKQIVEDDPNHFKNMKTILEKYYCKGNEWDEDYFQNNLFIFMWLFAMESYLNLSQKGIPMVGFRYEDLVKSPQAIVTEVFKYCQLPLSQIDNALPALSRDSQANSFYARNNVKKQSLNSNDIKNIRQRINNILQKHPKIKTSDFIAPLTFIPPC